MGGCCKHDSIVTYRNLDIPIEYGTVCLGNTMTDVTVDLKDLEALVWTTSVIKPIVQLLAARKNDPFVKPYLEHTETIDRLAAIVRDEQRKTAGTLIDYNGELTKEEKRLLNDVHEEILEDVTPTERKEHPEIDNLAAKGMIVLGQCAHAIVWAGANKPELKVDPSKFAVRITDRGRRKIEELNK